MLDEDCGGSDAVFQQRQDWPDQCYKHTPRVAFMPLLTGLTRMICAYVATFEVLRYLISTIANWSPY